MSRRNVSADLASFDSPNALLAWVIDLSLLESHTCRNLAEATKSLETSHTALCGLERLGDFVYGRLESVLSRSLSFKVVLWASETQGHRVQ